MPSYENSTETTPDTAADASDSADKNAPTRRLRPTAAELQDRDLRTDRLWDIEDVATFLRCSVRKADDYVKQPGMPQPRLVAKSGARLWAPGPWLRWMNEPETFYAAGDADTSRDAVMAGLTGMGAL